VSAVNPLLEERDPIFHSLSEENISKSFSEMKCLILLMCPTGNDAVRESSSLNGDEYEKLANEPIWLK
jgi:hypothetical protein